MTKYIHHTVPEQFSRQINEDYPYFVEFLQTYMEWLETEGSPYYHLKNHLNYLNFKDSLSLYVDLMKKEYLQSVPESVLASKELLIRYSKQFFQTIGTEKSFKFIFRILYDEDISIYYPRDDILKTSDGNWIQNESLMYVSNSGNVNSFLYRRIEQQREVYAGVYEYAYATVNRIIQRYANKFNFCEIYLTDIDGTFDINYPITVDGKEEWILPICDTAVIDNAGLNYVEDNVLTYNGDATFDIYLSATENGSIDTRYTTIFSESELIVKLNGSPLTGVSYDGKNLFHSSIVAGDTITLTFPIYSGLLVVDRVNSTGQIQDVKFVDTPFGILTDQEFDGTIGGNGAIIHVQPSLIREIPGYYFDNSGFLSDDKKLQDSDYYQDFSYVIKAGIDIDKYRDVVLKVLHPAGMKLFGEVDILELISLIIRSDDFSISIDNLADTIVVSSYDLWNRYGQVEDTKLVYDYETFKVNDFLNVSVDDILNTPNNFYNAHDSSVGPEYGQYIESGYIEDTYI
jgi:hypothetical protein